MDLLREIILILNNEFSNPSDEFVDFFARQVKTEKLTKEKFKKRIKLITLKSELDTASTELIHETEGWEDYYFIDPSRIVMQGAKSHCPITFDNNNKITSCRLYFNSKQKYVGFFDNESREEIKISINNINEFLELTDHFKKHHCNVR